MRHGWRATAVLVIATSISCASGGGGKPPGSTPAPGGGVAQAPAPLAPAPPPAEPAPGPPDQGGRAGGPPGGFRRTPLTPEQRAARRDSLTAVRAATIQELMTKIAGNENRPAGEQFANVQLMKDSTSAALLRTMDYFGKSLSVGCSFCHTVGKWDDDSRPAKSTARIMIQLVSMINTQGLSKLRPDRNGETPTINCVTCHRGNTGPGSALLP